MDETISNTNCENSIKNIDISLVIQKSKVKKVEKKEKLKRVITNTNIFHSLKQDFSFETQFRILNEVS